MNSASRLFEIKPEDLPQLLAIFSFITCLVLSYINGVRIFNISISDRHDKNSLIYSLVTLLLSCLIIIVLLLLNNLIDIRAFKKSSKLSWFKINIIVLLPIGISFAVYELILNLYIFLCQEELFHHVKNQFDGIVISLAFFAFSSLLYLPFIPYLKDKLLKLLALPRD